VNFIAIPKADTQTKLRCIGRITKNYYLQDNKLVSKSTFTLLKRKSQLTLQDMIDDPEYSGLNLDEYDEGIYEIITCNHSTDWETGVVDDWDLKLIPYKEEV
jgi:hypothetical protein